MAARISMKTDEDGTLVKGPYARPTLDDIPSPYLTGWMDSFLDDGYAPLIQSMRGCPFSCAFCVSGCEAWRPLRAFDLERVQAEFDYIKDRSPNRNLILCDENFGILKERDVDLARHIRESLDEDGFPESLYGYTSKIVTGHVKEIARLLKPLIALDMSFQTLDAQVVRNIGRTNMAYDRFMQTLQWARAEGIVTGTEMIFGFPGETVDTYLGGIEKLLRSGVERVQSYNLRLLKGIELSGQTARNKHGYKTRFRPPERCYGVYDGEVVAEAEEVVVGAASFDYADYLTVRKYGLFLELASGRGYLTHLINALTHFDCDGEKLVGHLAKSAFEDAPRLRDLLREYGQRAEAELFDSAEACAAHVARLLETSGEVPEVKLNLVYTGRIMLDTAIRKELLHEVGSFVDAHVEHPQLQAMLQEYLQHILPAQVVQFRKDEPHTQRLCAKLALDKFTAGSYADPRDLALDTPADFELTLEEDARRYIQESPLTSTQNEAALQDAYLKNRFGAMRRCT